MSSKEPVERETDVTLGNRITRATYIALIVFVSVLFVLVVVGFIWSLTYAGYSTMSEQQEKEQSSEDVGMLTTTAQGERIRIMGNSLLSVGERALTILYQGQGIMSQARTQRFYLSASGELFLEYRSNPNSQAWVRCWRSDTANQDGYKFFLGDDGYGYVVRADGTRVFCGNSYREYLQRRNAGLTVELPTDDGVKQWRTPNCRAANYRDCNKDKVGRTPPCLTSPDLPTGTCYASLIYRPFYLRFTDEGLEIVSISDSDAFGNANPPSASGPMSNLVLYPELKTNRKFPVPLWKVACNSTSQQLVVSECPKDLMDPAITGDCSKCPKVTTS